MLTQGVQTMVPFNSIYDIRNYHDSVLAFSIVDSFKKKKNLKKYYETDSPAEHELVILCVS